MNTLNQARIFISYSHRGNGLAWKDHLLAQLAVFEKHHLLDPWHDDETKLGDDWHARINMAMRSSRLAVLLLTDEFLKSPFVLQHELPELQRRHKEDGLIVAPILCEKCDWEANPWLASLQIKPREQATPVSLASLSQGGLDHVFHQLATEIAVELGSSALAELSSRHAPDSALGEAKTYLDKFPLTHGPGLREEKLIGREQELALLDLAFAQPHTAIVSLVAWGGVGKTMLVQHWLQRLQREGWFGARRVYAWSFYSQGTEEDRQASEDTFLANALAWFGVQCEPTLSPREKGRLLADAVAGERTLLVLDGIEPLQYPPGPMGGQLRAPGVQSLLKQLARKASSAICANQDSKSETNCLCLVTMREPLTDLADFQRREDSPWGSVLRVDLGNLTDEAGAALLHHAGANRAGAAEIKSDDKELLAASGEVDGHALTLNLLGRFLARAHGGNIRRRDLVKFEEADSNEQGGTTFKMLAAFENWFESEGDIEARSLAILRLLGLFDRPADTGCMTALRKSPIIAGLTEPLFTLKLDSSTRQTTEHPLTDKAWNDAIHFLCDFGLVAIENAVGNDGPLLDCHPLIREYFARHLRLRSTEDWRAAHARLFEHLSTVNPEKSQQTLEDLQPLFQAVRHGCFANFYGDALIDIWCHRIQKRPEEGYSFKKLGAFSSGLAALSCFFSKPWESVVSCLSDQAQNVIINETAFCLRALGRLSEAQFLFCASMNSYFSSKKWKPAAVAAGNCCELELALGEISRARNFAEYSVTFALKQCDRFEQAIALTVWADSLHQARKRVKARLYFRTSERIIASEQPDHPQLWGLTGFRYCDLILSKVGRSAWQVWLNANCNFNMINRERAGLSTRDVLFNGFQKFNPKRVLLRAACRIANERTMRSLGYAGERRGAVLYSVLENGLDHLTLARVAIYERLIHLLPSENVHPEIESAIDALRLSGEQIWLSSGLITDAWCCCIAGDFPRAHVALDEAWDIAERGPMRLHLADIHLHRARLFFREKTYPWKSPQADLAAAEKLINECGYHRRDQELADAKLAILGHT